LKDEIENNKNLTKESGEKIDIKRIKTEL